MLNAVTVVTVTLKITYVCVMLDGRVQLATYQTVLAILTASGVEPAMCQQIHHSVLTVTRTGWALPVMTLVYMEIRNQWIVVSVCVRRAGLVWVATQSAQNME